MHATTLFSRHASLSRHSGYDLVASALGAATISAPRGDPVRQPLRLGAQLLRAGAASRWYQGSSAVIEYHAARALRRERPDILHYLWADMDLGYLAPLIHRLSPRTKLVGTLHNPPFMLDQVLRRPAALKHFDALILMSTHQADYLERIGLERARLHVIPHGVNTTFFHPAPTRETRPFRALSVGGYLRNFDLLAQVCTGAPELDFEVIGPPAFARRFADMGNVRYRHGLTDEELAASYREASCLLLTITDATANNSLLEALASGLPVVSENIGGVPDYVNADCSLLAPAGSASSLIANLRTLAADPGRTNAMARAARAQAESLSWPQIADRTRALYAQLTEGCSA